MALLLFSLGLKAQWSPEEKQRIIEERIEYIAQDLESSDIDFTTLFDNLDELLDNPISLNSSSYEELLETQLFNDIQLAGIMAHRKRFGAFVSLFELKYVDGFNESNLNLILPFVAIGEAKKQKDFQWKWLLKGRNTVILRHQRILESSLAYSPADSNSSLNNRYLGDPNRVYARWRYQAAKKLSIGITAEKDPGEEFFKGTQKNGFDFYSAHIALSNIGVVKKLIIGDYQAQFGQGLVLWTGFGFRKSSQQVLNTRRFARGFVPYTSVDENNFLRGAAASVQLGNFEISSFYSQKQVDGNLDTSGVLNDLGADPVFTSFQRNGFHRTVSESFDKDAVLELIFGANLKYQIKNLRLGITAIQSEFDANFSPNLPLYNQFSLNTNKNQNYGAHYEWGFPLFQLYGEYAASANGATAQIHGISLNAKELLKINMHYRNKEPAFQNNYANSFGERSVSANEIGWYHGIELIPIKKLSLQAYLDLYRFPWLSFRSDRPSSGYEASVFADYQIMRNVSLTLLYRTEERERNYADDMLPVQTLAKERLDQYRLQLDYELNRSLSLRNRLEFRQYRLGEADVEEGFMLYQDISYNHKSNKWNLHARYALFQTDSYNARIYAYENDMRYQFTVPAYSGVGSRYYLLVNMKPISNLNISVRLARSFRTDVSNFGSGNDLIEGQYRTEIKSQVLYKF